MALAAQVVVETGKRRRGRPKGSKNKPKAILVVRKEKSLPVGETPAVAELLPTTKRKVGRPRKVVSSTVTSIVRPPAKKSVSSKPANQPKKITRPTSPLSTGSYHEMDSVTGFAVGSDQQKIAQALMEGAETRQAILDKVRTILPPTTSTGAPKAIPNLVSTVFRAMMTRGYILDSHYVVLPPTPASKRRATRLANKAKQAAAVSE